MIERKCYTANVKCTSIARAVEEQRVIGLRDELVMLSLDEDEEEILEYRTYQVLPNTKPSYYLINLEMLFQRRSIGKLNLEPERVIELAVDLREGTTFRFLAKRRKKDGLVSSILTVVTDSDHYLLSRQEWAQEAEYRQGVREFETDILPVGSLSVPPVIYCK